MFGITLMFTSTVLYRLVDRLMTDVRSSRRIRINDSEAALVAKMSHLL